MSRRGFDAEPLKAKQFCIKFKDFCINLNFYCLFNLISGKFAGIMEQDVTPQDAENLERKKVEIEEKKLEIELEKFKADKVKARYANFSIIFSLILTGVAIIGTQATALWQQRSEFPEFPLKAAEMVLAEKDHAEAYKTAKTLQRLFPSRLPDDFAEHFNPEVRDRENPVETPTPVK